MKKRNSMKRGTEHSTESEAGSQGDGKSGFAEKGARLGRRPLQRQEGGATHSFVRASLKVAATRGALVWCGGAGGYWGGFADGVAVDDKFYAAIALAAFGGVVGGYGLRFAEAAGGHRAACHALFGQEIADGVGAAFGELLVELVGADAVGVAFDLEREAFVGEKDAGNFGEFFAGTGLERGASGIEENVGHIDDEAAGGVTSLENGIELFKKLGA